MLLIFYLVYACVQDTQIMETQSNENMLLVIWFGKQTRNIRKWVVIFQAFEQNASLLSRVQLEESAYENSILKKINFMQPNVLLSRCKTPWNYD